MALSVDSAAGEGTALVGDFSPPHAVLGYTDAQIQRAACYAFAALSGLASVVTATASYFRVFQISILSAAPLVVIAGGLLYFASKIPDLQPHSELVYTRLEEMVKKYGLDALFKMFTVEQLKQRFDQELRDPKTTFWSIVQVYDIQALFDHGVIDKAHFDLLQDLKQKAEVYKDICFPHQRRHVLTLFANQPQAFRAIIAMDAEYKSKIVGEPLPTPQAINYSDLTTLPPSVIQGKQFNYVDARIKRFVGYAFATLASMATLGVTAVAYVGIFNIKNIAVLATVPLIATVASIIFASNVIDYRNPSEQKALREQFSKTSNLIDFYREHGLVNLLQVFTVDELKQKFKVEVLDPKTTFWNVLRRYNLQELHQAGIITSQHLALLTNLRQLAEPLNVAVYPRKERWKKVETPNNVSHHIHTAFASEPQAYRMVEILDRTYKERFKELNELNN